MRSACTDVNSGLTAEKLREYLDYNPDSGQLIWRVNQCGRSGFIGRPAGCLSKGSGYVLVGLTANGLRRIYRAHRLIWLHVTGAWPTNEIDHINQVRNDNRFTNLRDVERRVNSQNERLPRKNNKTGFLGVSWCAAEGNYHAQIHLGNRHCHVGRFATPESAHAAYVEAKRRLHEGCTL